MIAKVIKLIEFKWFKSLELRYVRGVSEIVTNGIHAATI